MKPRLILSVLCMTMFVSLSAQTSTSTLIKCFRASREELGDSLDVYKAYLFKMLGNALYAEVDESSNGMKYAEQASKYYVNSLKVFGSRGSDDNAYVLLKELAQLFYKVKAYSYAYDYLGEVKSRYQDRLDNGISDEELDFYNTLSQMALCKAKMASVEKSDNSARELFEQSIAQIDSAVIYGQKRKDAMFYNWMRVKGKILMMQYDRLNIDNKKVSKDCYEQYVNYQRNTVSARLALTEGKNTIKVFAGEPGVIIEKLVIKKKDFRLPESYLGPYAD